MLGFHWYSYSFLIQSLSLTLYAYFVICGQYNFVLQGFYDGVEITNQLASNNVLTYLLTYMYAACAQQPVRNIQIKLPMSVPGV